MKALLRSLEALSILLCCAWGTAWGRGAIPPPPPFTGGNVGEWLGNGPIFGFDDGGGPGGGWGGGYYDGGGWGGWGWGSGGAGGYQGNGASGRGAVWSGEDHGGLHGTCRIETIVGTRYECACFIRYNGENPPKPGAPVQGVCRLYLVNTGDGCRAVGDICATAR